MATIVQTPDGLRMPDLPGVTDPALNDLIRTLRAEIQCGVMPVCRRHMPGLIVASAFNPSEVAVMLPRLPLSNCVSLAMANSRCMTAALSAAYENEPSARQWGDHMYAFYPICKVAAHWDDWTKFLKAAVLLDDALNRIDLLRDEYNAARRVIETVAPDLRQYAAFVTRLIPE